MKMRIVDKGGNEKKREDNMYNLKYGNIPSDVLDRIRFILGKKAENEKFNLDIQKQVKRIRRMKKSKVEFTLWKIIKPSARPRVSMQTGCVHMYVPGAAQAGKWFETFYKENDLPYINTPCTINITVYEQTPSSFTMKQKVIAELGYLRPWKRTGDFDNYAKTIADMLQHGMLEDDCLIVSSTVDLKYSIKPHCDISIEYYNEFPKI